MEDPIEQARKRADAIKQARTAGVGEVGIFWFFKGKILSDPIPHTLGEEYGDFINGRSDHCTYWPSLQRLSTPAVPR